MEKESLDAIYWDNRYNKTETGWDIGSVSAPLKAYIDQLSDKHLSILIPGCGNAYEAEYLLQHVFTNITLIDISFVLVKSIKQKFAAYSGKQLHVIEGDFFKLERKSLPLFDCELLITAAQKLRFFCLRLNDSLKFVVNI